LGASLKKCDISSEKDDEKFFLETGERERGVKGMILACCLPAGGERGSPS